MITGRDRELSPARSAPDITWRIERSSTPFPTESLRAGDSSRSGGTIKMRPNCIHGLSGDCFSGDLLFAGAGVSSKCEGKMANNPAVRVHGARCVVALAEIV